MKWSRIEAGGWTALAALCLVLATGCGRGSVERREARDRDLRRAEIAREAQDIDRAIELCEKALRRRPDLALAHRKLGLMLDNFRQDYVSAIYHYQRYLQLRPDTKTRAEVEQLIQHCRLSFAAQIAESPEEVKKDLRARDARIQQLELELFALREQTSMTEPEFSAKSKGLVKSAKESAAAKSASPKDAAPAQVHVVQSGESLNAISMRYYGTPAKWAVIFKANRDRVPDANHLRVGTRLDIPPP